MSLLETTRYHADQSLLEQMRLAQALPEVPADPLTFARETLRFNPDEKQAEILSSGANSGIVNCSRQWGKSTLMAILTVHRALTKPHSLILYVAPTIRQSGELFDKAMHFLWQLNIRHRSDGRNPHSACLANGSRIVALPSAANRIRGFSAPSMIVIDEAAQVPDSVYITLRPMLLVSAGDLWLISTPWGKRGFFHQEWASPDPDWKRFKVPASACARFDPKQLDRQKCGVTESFYRQEFECEFIDPDEALFPMELILGAITNEVDPMLIWS